MTVLTSPAPSTSADAQREAPVVRSWKSSIALGVFAIIAILLFFVAHRSGTTNFRLSTDADAFTLPLAGSSPLLAVVLYVAVVVLGGWAIVAASRRAHRRGLVSAIVVTALALGFVTFVTAGPATAPVDALVVPIVVTVVLILLALASAAFVFVRASSPLWLAALFAVLFLFAFLTWAAAGATLPVPGLLVGSVSLSAPLIYGALGGVLSERVGVVNVAIEGQLLGGAFVAALVASLTHNPYIGLIAAPVAGVLVSFVLAAFSIKYFVDQVIVGVVLNVLVTGLTNFLFSKVLSADAAVLNTPPRFDRISLPVLGDIPILGPVLFRQTIIVYIMYIAVFVVWYALFRTKWGLRVRSVGEHPQAADTVGINVNRTRFWTVSLAGAIAGLGGAYFTLGSVGAFGREMTAGAGFIALAAVIFGRWDPVRATLAALLFGFASNLQNVLSIIGSPVPSEFMLMLPYVVTIFAVAGLVGRVRGPAASGKPYIKS